MGHWTMQINYEGEGSTPADAVKALVSDLISGKLTVEYAPRGVDSWHEVPPDLVEGCARHAMISAAPSVAIWRDDERAAKGLDPWCWRVNGVVDDYAPTYAKAARMAQQYSPEAKKESSL